MSAINQLRSSIFNFELTNATVNHVSLSKYETMMAVNLEMKYGYSLYKYFICNFIVWGGGGRKGLGRTMKGSLEDVENSSRRERSKKVEEHWCRITCLVC